MPQGILCFGAQIGVQQLFNSFCCYSPVWNLFFGVKKTSRELCKGPRDGRFFRDWRSTLKSLLLRVDKAKDRVKLPASVERKCLSRHSFRKISADRCLSSGQEGRHFSSAGSEDCELEMVRPLKTGE